MLLDEFCPEYDFREVHSLPTRARAEAVLQALRDVTPAELPLTEYLMRIRSIPSFLAGQRYVRSTNRPFLEQIIGSGFLLLGTSGREVLVGTVGKFWRPTGGLCLSLRTEKEFREFNEPGWAKAGWNVTIEKDERGRRIRTETRILCTDRSARTKFRLYWWMIRPASGMIRKSILQTLRKKAEQQSGV